jgi:hypothetical protein
MTRDTPHERLLSVHHNFTLLLYEVVFASLRADIVVQQWGQNQQISWC